MLNTYHGKLKIKNSLDSLKIKLSLVAKQFENKLSSKNTKFYCSSLIPISHLPNNSSKFPK